MNMKAAWSFCWMLLIGAGVRAQSPVITAAEFASTPGQSFLKHYAGWLAPGPSGIDQTWDFSSLSPDSSFTENVLDTAGAPSAAQFPAATHVRSNGDGRYHYFKQVGYLFSYLGFADPDGYVSLSNEQELLHFPMQYGLFWYEAWTGPGEYLGDAFIRNGLGTVEMDAYGTLILPGATIEDVIRVHSPEEYVDHLSSGDVNYVTDRYWWIAAGTPTPLLSLFQLTVTSAGDTLFGTQRAEYVDVSVITDVAEAGDGTTFSVFPNPAHGTIRLSFDPRNDLNGGIQVWDMTGRCVLSLPLSGSVSGRSTIDLRGLPSGSYVILLRTRDGGVGASKVFVVEKDQ